jgi:hypothetical protein
MYPVERKSRAVLKALALPAEKTQTYKKKSIVYKKERSVLDRKI